jgi:hypothetical protein
VGTLLVAAAAAVLAWAGPAWGQRGTPVQLLQPAGAVNDQFGYSVAIDGDTMIVGAPSDDVGANADQGSAHIYRWTGSGWAFEATLTASDGAANDWFGVSVALSGDTAVVGAYADDVGANADQGSAYIFVRSGSTWTQQAKLTASDGAANDAFGISVALSGDTALVGAYADDVGANADQGSAYIFVRSGSTWTQQARLTASDGAANDAFGISVALSEDTALVGAFVDDVGANANQGSAYVFVRSGSTWTQQARLTASDGAANDVFGNSVALSGNTALVAAYLDDVGANVNQGSAYVFVRSGSTWTQQAKLTASDGAASDSFGVSVALSGDTAVVGAEGDDIGANADQGSAYVFVRSGSPPVWTQQARLTASDGAASDSFGVSVALSGDTALVGAYEDDVGANANQGSAWVFSRIGSRWIGPDMTLLASDGAAGDNLGYSVALSGDTALVGAYLDDVGANANQGSAYVFVRSGMTWTQQTKLTASDGAANDFFGISVAISGDTALVAAYGDDVGANAEQGSAYVFVRSGTPPVWTQQAKLTASDGAASDWFGTSVALSGDTALVGAYFDDVGANTNQGSAYVFVRSGTTWTQQTRLTASDGLANDNFGVSVALSGDTALVGAYADDVGANANQGSAYVFTRSGTTWTQQVRLTASDGAAGDAFGISVALSEDTALVGAYADDIGANADQGSAYVFVRSGSPPVWTQQARLTASDGAASDWFGTSVALSGDTAVVGAYQDDVGANADQGSAYVFVRSGSTWTQQARLTASDGAAGDVFGVSAALSGSTALVGAPFDLVGANANQGSARTFDVAYDGFSLAHNDSLGIAYPTLAAALLPAQSGHQITATTEAWANIGLLDSFGRSLGLFGHDDIRTPPTSILTLGGSSVLAVPTGSTIDIFGQCLTASGGSGYILADAFRLGSRGILTARTGSSLTINAPTAALDGQTRLEQGSSVTFAGSAVAIGPTTCSYNSSLAAGGPFTNIDTFTITAGTISTPLFQNRAAANIFGSSALFGSYTNDAGAVTTIRSGTLFVFGTLTNNGTIVGTICSNCAGSAPNLEVGGGLVLGPGASLLMPFVGSLVRVGGVFDCAIDSNTRYDLALATLQLEGTGAEQGLEVMSRDIGPSAAGLDRTIAGHYPVGTVEIGPAPSTVRLVDARDNDGLGQASCEALYVDTLRIHAGSRLINTACRVYYRTLVNNGTVDVPGNLRPICRADYDGNGLIEPADVSLFVNRWFVSLQQGTLEADFDGNGAIEPADVSLFVQAWFAAVSGGC